MGIRATARPGLISGQFRQGPVHVREGQWAELDANEPAVREVLLAFVPSHIRLVHGQDRELEAAGLAFKDAKLVDLRALAAAEKAETEKAKAPAPASSPTKEKARSAEKS